MSDVTLTLPAEVLEGLRREIAADVLAQLNACTAWLNVHGAAEHLAMTNDAIRAMVKRGTIPHHRTRTGRIRFEAAELDAWARGEA